MIKRTLYFGNSAYLSKKHEQLVIQLPHAQGMDHLSGNTVPIEDIGLVVLDHQQITITQGLMASLLENNVALITCDHSHLPMGMMLNLCGNKLQSARFNAQIESTLPLRKQLWQQTVKAKISNQALHLLARGIPADNMLRWAEEVKSGDPDNLEARAAVYYWKYIFPEFPEFKREREGSCPNNLLNYIYAILRGIVARALTGSGLLPTLGIHHHNQYNAYCLADDIMEPFRPFADKIICDVVRTGADITALTTSIKRELLGIASVDISIDGERSPLMVGLQRTTASLARCYEGKGRKILYPEFM